MKKIKWAALAAFLIFPLTVLSQIEITEIMYDLPGTDSGREWIEISNTSSSPIDLTGWKFFDGTNHNLNAPPKNGGQGSLLLQAGSVAILASDAEVFLLDNPGFSGTVIDTVMSLTNTSLTIKIINGEGSEVDSVSYSKEMGGAGDENSLQRNSSGWVAGRPSPGSSTSLSGGGSPVDFSDEKNQESSGNEIEDFALAPPEFGNPIPDKIIAEAGNDRLIMSGAEALFSGKAYGLKGELLKDARFVWNFGDGGVKEGESIMYSYDYPGTYNVVLDIYWGNYTASDSLKVKVVPVAVTISEANVYPNSYVKIKNISNSDIDISFWHLRTLEQTWTFPKGTVIFKNSEITLGQNKTGFSLNNNSQIELLYPSARIASTYSFKKEVEEVKVSNPVYYSTPSSRAISYVDTSNIDKKVAGAFSARGDTNEALAVVNESFDSTNDNSPENKSITKWILFLVGFIGTAVLFSLLIKNDDTEKALFLDKKDDIPEAREFEILDDILD